VDSHQGQSGGVNNSNMAFKLLEMAEQRWRRLNGAHLLPLVRAGVRFVDGMQIERQESNASLQAAKPVFPKAT